MIDRFFEILCLSVNLRRLWSCALGNFFFFFSGQFLCRLIWGTDCYSCSRWSLSPLLKWSNGKVNADTQATSTTAGVARMLLNPVKNCFRESDSEFFNRFLIQNCPPPSLLYWGWGQGFLTLVGNQSTRRKCRSEERVEKTYSYFPQGYLCECEYNGWNWNVASWAHVSCQKLLCYAYILFKILTLNKANVVSLRWKIFILKFSLYRFAD